MEVPLFRPRSAVLVALVSGLLLAPSAAFAAAEVHRFNLALSAAPTSLLAGDFNDGIAFYNRTVITAPPRGYEPLDKVSFSWLFDGEFRYFMTRNLALSAGVGQIRAKSAKEYLPALSEAINVRADLISVPVHVGAAYSDGTLPANFGLSQRTEGRGVTFFNTASFSGDNVQRQRQGLEAALAWGPVKLQSEVLNVTYKGAVPTESYDRSVDANYVEALWLITGEHYADAYKAGAFGRIIPKSNFALNGGGWGAFEIGLRMSQFDASDFKPGNTAGTGRLAGQTSTALTPQLITAANKATATTVGLKWILNPNFKFYLNYVNTKFDTDIVVRPNYSNLPNATASAERAVTLRAALDF